MEKLVSAQRGRRGRQALWILLGAIAIVAWGAFDQVSAGTMQLVLSPAKLLDHGELGGSTVDQVAHRSDPPLHSDAVNFSMAGDSRDQHALRSNLASAERRQAQKLPMLSNGLTRAVMEDDALDLHQKVPASGTAHVLRGDGHRQWNARVHHLLPLVDQRDANDHVSRPHALVEVLGEDAKILHGDLVGSRGYGVSSGGALVRLGGRLQPFSGNALRITSSIDALLGKTDTIHRGLEPLPSLIQADQQAGRAQHRQQQLRPGKECYLPGPLGCSPLSAKIGALLVCGLVAWSLIFRIFDLLDRPRRNWVLITFLGTMAAALYLLPSYLVVGFPWNW